MTIDNNIILYYLIYKFSDIVKYPPRFRNIILIVYTCQTAFYLDTNRMYQYFLMNTYTQDPNKSEVEGILCPSGRRIMTKLLKVTKIKLTTLTLYC